MLKRFLKMNSGFSMKAMHNCTIGWGNYGMCPLFTPCVSWNYPKTWGKNGRSIFKIFAKLIAID